MENNTHQTHINGVPIKLGRMTDEELLAGLGHAEARLDGVWSDIAKYQGEIALRPSLTPPEGEQPQQLFEQ